LATKRVRGGGPDFFKAGPSILYRKSSVDAWALAYLGDPVANTSEYRQRRAASEAVATP